MAPRNNGAFLLPPFVAAMGTAGIIMFLEFCLVFFLFVTSIHSTFITVVSLSCTICSCLSL
jgi:hypothetical protein